MFLKKISIVAFIITCLCANISVFAGETETYKVVVPFIYDDASGFMDGYAQVRLDGKIGLIDKNGSVVVPLEYQYIGWNFYEGITTIIKVGEFGRKSGFVDRAGNIITPPIYDDTGNFQDGLAVVRLDDKIGVIDTEGNVVIPFIYGGYQRAYFARFKEGLMPVELDGKWGYIDTAGNVIIPFEYSYAVSFYDGYAVVAVGEMENLKYGIIDISGNVVVPFIYDYIPSNYNNGLTVVAARTSQKLKYGAIDTDGNVVIPLIYDEVILSYSDEMAYVGNGTIYDMKLGCVDRQGNVVVPVIYDVLDYFDDNDGVAYFNRDNSRDDRGNLQHPYDGVQGLIDREGNEVVFPDDWSVYKGFSEGLIAVQKDGLIGFANAKGELVIPFRFLDPELKGYSMYYTFSNGLTTVLMEDGVFRQIDKEGNIYIPYTTSDKYDSYRGINGNPAAVQLDGKWGFINDAGELIIPFIFDDARGFIEGLAAVCMDGKWGYIALTNKEADKVRLSDIRDNYAWAISRFNENPRSKLVALEYSSDEILEGLVLAVDADCILPAQYAGVKEADGIHGNDYYPGFDGVTGPYWIITEGTVDGRRGDFVLLPASCRPGILELTPAVAERSDADGFDNHDHPLADPEDIAIMENARGGRKVMHSELLCTDQNGGRISLFQFENTGYGLLVLAYFQGDKIITKEYIAHVYEDGAYWRADAEGDDICEFRINMLCETDEGLVIAYTWYGPEGIGYHLLLEKEGVFIDFINEYWDYSMWEDEFYHIEYEIRTPELWPELDCAALEGTWEGKRDSSWASKEDGEDVVTFLFNPDGTGEKRSFNRVYPITYYVDGNLVVFTEMFNKGSDNERVYNDFCYAKIEGGQLIMDGYPALTRKESII